LVGEPLSTTVPAPDVPAIRVPAPGGPLVPPLLRLDDVAYQYPGRPTPALESVNLQIGAGERILVEGASGGGKSTFAALLTGLKLPSQGRLHLRGVDQRALGIDTWRRAIAGAPQFHDNHVLGTDLLFNLLMGRRWPPRLCDLVAAERVCRQLGLGPLLERMPSGLQQQVGESGWQLSHGERSRLFIARSLLQSVEARVLDESFAALDPQTLDEVLATVLSHPETLIVIAHP
jgi:ABC-type transport system involved in cytochrome bd biosynthesis fused ATPase/permease subunit